MNYNIALLKGDGIGPEIVTSAVKVLEKVGAKFGHTFNFTDYLIGGIAIDTVGEGLPKETVDGCLASDSVMLGAVGGPKWDTLPGNQRPEKALLGIRSALGLYTNLRPAKLYPALSDVPESNGYKPALLQSDSNPLSEYFQSMQQQRYPPEQTP